MKLEAKIYLWRKKGEREKTSGLVSCLLSCFPCCFSSCLLLFFKHSNWSVLSVPKSFKNQCSLAHWQNSFQNNSFQNQYLRKHFLFKTVFFPLTKPVPFQHQYQTKTLRICQLNILLSSPRALWPWPKFW